MRSIKFTTHRASACAGPVRRWWARLATTGFALLMLASLDLPASDAQAPVTGTAQQVNKKLAKLFGAGGFKGLPSYGTGIVVSPYGHILTCNNHILATTDLRVHLYDGRFFHAKVIAKEPELDVALIKLDENIDKLPYYNFEAEAAKPIAKVGTFALAFSNQFQIATRDEPMSVMHGVVSAFADLKGRKGVFDAPYQGKVYFLDTIACNPGSAGGALTNLKGELLGVLGRELKNKLSDSWINYAVPIQAKTEVIREGKTVTVTMAEFVRDAMAGKYKETKKKEVAKGPGPYTGILLVPNAVAVTPPYIDGVIPGSPADKAGLRPDDLIVYVDGELVQSIAAYRALMAGYRPGTQVRLDVQRGNQLQTIMVSLEQHPTPKAP